MNILLKPNYSNCQRLTWKQEKRFGFFFSLLTAALLTPYKCKQCALHQLSGIFLLIYLLFFRAKLMKFSMSFAEVIYQKENKVLALFPDSLVKLKIQSNPTEQAHLFSNTLHSKAKVSTYEENISAFIQSHSSFFLQLLPPPKKMGCCIELNKRRMQPFGHKLYIFIIHNIHFRLQSFDKQSERWPIFPYVWLRFSRIPSYYLLLLLTLFICNVLN